MAFHLIPDDVMLHVLEFINPINLYPLAHVSYRFYNLVQYSRHSEWILLDLDRCVPDGGQEMLTWFFSSNAAKTAHACYAAGQGRIDAISHITSIDPSLTDNTLEIAQQAAAR